jgi:UDP-glucose 4-epimerase
MNILVTGAAGYIASICSELLLKAGHTVVGLDNFSEGHRSAVPPGVRFFECDLNDAAALDLVFASAKIDAVMHFAAVALVGESVKDPSKYYRINVAYGILLLDAMTRHGVRNFVLSSTTATYGEPKSTPIREDHEIAPINPYGRSKALLERLLAEYREWTGLNFVALRYFNVAGASAERGEDHRTETHVIPMIFEAALGKRPHFEIHGGDYPTPDGTCIRDYIHVVDLAEAHILALENMERFAGQAFNLGTGRGYSVKELVETVEGVTGRKVATRVGPRRPGDPSVLVASWEKFRREARWNPKYSDLETIVRTAWDWKQRHPRGYPD